MKQKAVRRKLAYDYNLVGRSQSKNQSVLGAKNWSITKAVGKTRSRLATSFSKDASSAQNKMLLSSQNPNL